MDLYIATDLLKYVISNYCNYSTLKILDKKYYKCHPSRITEHKEDNSTVIKIDDEIVSDHYIYNYDSHKKIYDMSINFRLYTHIINNNIVFVRANNKSKYLYKQYNDDSTFKNIEYEYRNNYKNKITDIKYFSNGFLHSMQTGSVYSMQDSDIRRFFYSNIYTNPKIVKYWWENYISTEITYGSFNSRRCIVSKKYYDKTGKCTRLKIYNYKYCNNGYGYECVTINTRY